MKRVFFILAALAAWTATAATPNRTATEAYVTNKIEAAASETLDAAKSYTDAATNGVDVGVTSVNGETGAVVIPEADFSTLNGVLVETILATAPAPGNYANVSNAAMNAVRPPELAAATNATAAAIAAKRGKADLAVYASELSDEWSLSGSALDPSKAYKLSVYYEPPHWIYDLLEEIEVGWFYAINSYSVFTDDEEHEPDIEAITPDMWREVPGMDVTATRRRVDVPTDDRLATTSGVASAISAAVPQAVTNIVRDLSLGGIWDSQLEIWWTPRMRNGSLTYEATTNVNLNAEN